jgi:hypothetical protein
LTQQPSLLFLHFEGESETVKGKGGIPGALVLQFAEPARIVASADNIRRYQICGNKNDYPHSKIRLGQSVASND